MGILPRASGNKKFLFAATEYFIMEVKLLTQIREMDVIRFIRKNIMSKFNIPKAFVSNNKTQFIGKKIKDMLGQLKIESYNSTPNYP